MAVTRVVDKDGRCIEYERRRPEQSTLYRIVQDNIETLFAEAEGRSEHGFGYPEHVKREFWRYLSCGILSAWVRQDLVRWAGLQVRAAGRLLM